MHQLKYFVCLLACSSIIVGCGTTNSNTYKPNQDIPRQSSMPTPIPPQSNPVKSITEGLPQTPEVIRAFFGVKVDDCVDKRGRGGVYVTGFFYLNGISPAQTGFLRVGDRIERINDRVEITAKGLTEYISKVANEISYAWYIDRNGKKLKAKIFSMARKPGHITIPSTPTYTCDDVWRVRS